MYDFMMNKIEELCKKYSKEQLFNLGKELSFKERLKFDYKISCYFDNKKYEELFSDIYHRNTFLEKLIQNNELEYILDNYREIIILRDRQLPINILNYIKLNKDKIEKENITKIEDAITTVIYKGCSTKANPDITELYNLIKNVALDENVDMLDIKLIGYGAFFNVYRLGNKVIKVGYNRQCKTIPDSNRLLIPDIRKKVGSVFVEVNDYIECIGDASKEEMYKVYEDERVQNLKWLDPMEGNAGRIDARILESIKRKRMTIRLQDVGIEENEKALPFDLNIDDLIIFDLDHIFWENDIEAIEMTSWDLSEGVLARYDIFEERFKREHPILVLK